MRPIRFVTFATAASLVSVSVALLSGACSSSEPSGGDERLGRTQAGATLATPGFVETTVIGGLNAPTVVRFAGDGRVFVAEKSGRILVYDSLTDTAPDVFTNLADRVHDFWDRGLLGMTLDPSFPTKPYVYVLYAYDGDPGDASPKWGDGCPTPPGATADGCVISGRLSRFTASGNTAGTETVLIEGWRQQYPSHATGQVEFGPDGALYASGGDGANLNFVDYGQDGNPINPLGDPPVAVGEAQTLPDAQGGALRSQSLRRPSGPVLLNGSVIRVDPETGLGKADNPLSAATDLNAQRIIAYGLRNPFRIAARPGKNELWIADVGWTQWEEVNRIPLGAAEPLNFGWPCYEGVGKQAGYDSLNLTSCEALYASGDHAPPFFAYDHAAGVSANDGCGRGTSSVTGIAFYTGTSYPSAYHGAMFFADYSRRCIYMMEQGPGGDPDPASARSFHVNADGPVFLTNGPGGDLYYAALSSGTIQRISYLQPAAAFTAAPTQGQVPLIVNFDSASSVKPLPEDELSYAWDLDGDGAFDDSTDANPAFLYDTVASYAVRLKVTDQRGISDISAPLVIQATTEPPPVSTPPAVFIDTPSADLHWKAGDEIQFTGHATDAEDGELPASALSWQVVIQHCPDGCHIHDLLSFEAVAAGSFVAEDHAYPMHLELILTATDSSGEKRTARRSLQPSTVSLVFDTKPSNLDLVVGASAQTTPFARRVIVGSENTVSAPETQRVGGVTWKFASWSDGLPRSHSLLNVTSAARYVAMYTPSGGLTGEYFDQLAFAGEPLSRVDPVLDFNWGQGTPEPSMAADTFSVRWTGEVKIDFEETYEFATVSDDGVRLWIDGVSVIDHFTNHAPVRDAGSLALTPGWHPIVLEYYENGGGAQLSLSWSSPSQAAAIIPESHLRPGCGAEGSCSSGLSCSADGTCLPSCDPSTCKGSKHCRLNGATSCVTLCTGMQCPTGDKCNSGLCLDACSGISCAAGTHCELGKCVTNPPDGAGGAGGAANDNETGAAGLSGNEAGSAGAFGNQAGAGGDANNEAGGAGASSHQAGSPGSLGGENGSAGARAGEGGVGGELSGDGGMADASPAELGGQAGEPGANNSGGSPGTGATAGAGGEGGAESVAGNGGGSSGGCSCRAVGATPSGGAVIGLGLLLALGRRRRRA